MNHEFNFPYGWPCALGERGLDVCCRLFADEFRLVLLIGHMSAFTITLPLIMLSLGRALPCRLRWLWWLWWGRYEVEYSFVVAVFRYTVNPVEVVSQLSALLMLSRPLRASIWR